MDGHFMGIVDVKLHPTLALIFSYSKDGVRSIAQRFCIYFENIIHKLATLAWSELGNTFPAFSSCRSWFSMVGSWRTPNSGKSTARASRGSATCPTTTASCRAASIPGGRSSSWTPSGARTSPTSSASARSEQSQFLWLKFISLLPLFCIAPTVSTQSGMNWSEKFP